MLNTMHTDLAALEGFLPNTVSRESVERKKGWHFWVWGLRWEAVPSAACGRYREAAPRAGDWVGGMATAHACGQMQEGAADRRKR